MIDANPNPTPTGRCARAATQTVDDVLLKENTDVERGLGEDEVAKRRARHGPNEMDVKDSETLLQKFLGQFKDPLIMLLLASALVSVLAGQADDAVSISLAIVIVVTVAFVQEYRSDKALEELNHLVPHTCRCLRGGKLSEIDASLLVPGDVVEVVMGDRIPADLRLVSATSLEVDESSLTGEVVPVQKHTEPVRQADTHTIANLHCIGFMGTLVCSGHARGVVVATGHSTELGSIFELMEDTETPRSPLQRKMDELGKQLSMVSIAVIVVIALVGVAQGRSAFAMFQIGVSLAVAAIPEGLPICVTVTLALGVMRMAAKKAIVKKLPAVEALGCTNVVCADKTGTLTQNQMTVRRVYCHGIPERIEVLGNGYELHKSHRILVDDSAANKATCPALSRMLEIGAVCNNAKIRRGGAPIGQPTEIALLIAAAKLGVEDMRLKWPRKREISFSSDTKWMAVQCSVGASELGCQGPSNGKAEVYFVKGIGEKIVAQCQSFSRSGRLDDTCTLEQGDREAIEGAAQNMAREGLRVLALAYGTDIDNLCFAGLVGIMDPPREEVFDAIGELLEAEIAVKMLTGDSKETALCIAAQLRIYEEGLHKALSGAELEAMSDEQLAGCVESVSVFYRSAPRHKLKIVRALQRLGQVVAMTGDGVNDAPALKAAEIGVAMGQTGTDVCKEAADLILVDDRFTTILEAVKEGKGIFYNICNFLRFQLSTALAALSLIAICTFYGLNPPLNPMQILWINIIMDGPPAQSLGVEPVDSDVMLQPPRRATDPIISKTLIKRVCTAALFIVAGTFYIYHREMVDGEVTNRDTTMTFTTFVFFDLFNALSCRSESKSVFALGLFANRAFVVAVGCSLVGQLLVIYFGPLQRVFQTEALSLADLALIAAVASSLFVFDEVRKLLTRRHTTPQHALYTKLPTELKGDAEMV